MIQRLTFQTVLITGGATGIGLGMSTAFAAYGANVAVMGRRKNILDEAVAKLASTGSFSYYLKV